MDENRETAWNIAMQQSLHVSNLIQKSVTQFLSGDLKGQYWTLVAIRRLINYDLSVSEKKDMDRLEAEINKLLIIRAQKNSLLNKQIKRYPENQRSVLANKVKIYHLKLGDILNSLGFFPKKEDRSKLNF